MKKNGRILLFVGAFALAGGLCGYWLSPRTSADDFYANADVTDISDLDAYEASVPVSYETVYSADPACAPGADDFAGGSAVSLFSQGRGANDFSGQMRARGYSVEERSEEAGPGLGVDHLLVANSPDLQCQIAFYDFDSEKHCSEEYEQICSGIKAQAGNQADAGNTENGETGHLQIETPNGYYYVSRKNDTLVSASTRPENREDVIACVTDLGY